MKALKHYWSNYWFLPAFSFIVCLLTFLLRVEYAWYVLWFFTGLNVVVFVGSWISYRGKVKRGIL